MTTYHQTVLIVDDDADDLLLMASAFRAVGVRGPIHTIAGGREAMAYMEGEGKYADRHAYPYPTFITTDLKMPGDNGFALLKYLGMHPEWAGIATVVFSSSRDADDIKNSYLLGASSYHVKPNSYEDLQRQLKVLHAYWLTCQVPEVDGSGRPLPTNGDGKLGAGYV